MKQRAAESILAEGTGDFGEDATVQAVPVGSSVSDPPTDPPETVAGVETPRAERARWRLRPRRRGGVGTVEGVTSRHYGSSMCSSASTMLWSIFFSPRRMFFETAVVETPNSSASVDSVAFRGLSK